MFSTTEILATPMLDNMLSERYNYATITGAVPLPPCFPNMNVQRDVPLKYVFIRRVNERTLVPVVIHRSTLYQTPAGLFSHNDRLSRPEPTAPKSNRVNA